MDLVLEENLPKEENLGNSFSLLATELLKMPVPAVWGWRSHREEWKMDMDADPVKETELVPLCESLPPSAPQEGLVKCESLIISACASLILQRNIGVACNCENWNLLRLI